MTKKRVERLLNRMRVMERKLKISDSYSSEASFYVINTKVRRRSAIFLCESLKSRALGSEIDARKSKLKRTNWKEFHESVLAESVNDVELVYGSNLMRESLLSQD